jgi:hypothetical protein
MSRGELYDQHVIDHFQQGDSTTKLGRGGLESLPDFSPAERPKLLARTQAMAAVN